MRKVTDPDRLRDSHLKSVAEIEDFREVLNLCPESDAVPIINSAALISLLRGIAERVCELERRLDRAEKKLWNGEEFPEDVVSKLAGGLPPLKVFRNFRGMTQKEIAAKAGCTTTYISHLEQRNRIGSMKMLRRFANILEIDVRELVER